MTLVLVAVCVLVLALSASPVSSGCVDGRGDTTPATQPILWDDVDDADGDAGVPTLRADVAAAVHANDLAFPYEQPEFLGHSPVDRSRADVSRAPPS